MGKFNVIKYREFYIRALKFQKNRKTSKKLKTINHKLSAFTLNQTLNRHDRVLISSSIFLICNTVKIKSY